MIDVVLVWVVGFGVWPFADPGHDMDTVGSVLDVGVHILAAGLLSARWRVVRRTSIATNNPQETT